ncbi:MAG: hypothetical protein A2Y40_03450 [Candidatus Margulisbacteria bacterium GWF2_35_9]|nr:MAG: hypothetical protein A2Y40_03450 [Candidatus Margulisbacteria bacterium GWF2_35_9]
MNKILQTTRHLRKEQTESEKIFWEIVRNRKVNGTKFNRQFPIKFKFNNHNRFFVADFYCHERKVVVEIDGSIHEKQKDYDKLREYIINILGIKVIRFKNNDIKNNISYIVEQLEIILNPPLF